MSEPIRLRYEGEGDFRVLSNYWAGRADKAFVVGEVYSMAEVNDRSAATHNHYFACLSDAWSTLPEDRQEEFPTVEHLRKKMLIRCSYADERSIVCASKAEAHRVAAFIRPMDDYAIVIVREAVVRVLTAKSQSRKAMGAKVFQESKQAVLDEVAALIGVTSDDLARQGGMAA